MEDPLTLSVLGAAALTQGIAFVYSQTGELLKRRRERHDKLAGPQPAPQADILAGTPDPQTVDHGMLDRVADEMAALRRELSDYADGISPVRAGDQHLLMTLHSLRELLEAAYGQRFTFRGEDRELSGPVVVGSIDVAEVLGRAVAVRAGRVTGPARVEGRARAEQIGAGG